MENTIVYLELIEKEKRIIKRIESGEKGLKDELFAHYKIMDNYFKKIDPLFKRLIDGAEK